MKILLTGSSGQLGWELQRTLAPLGELKAADRRAMDLSVPQSIRPAMREFRPDLIVNAAAYTAVDQAETEPALAHAVNGVAPGIIAEEAKRLGAFLVHFSTGYVFDGKKTAPYTEDDRPNPLNAYGASKLAGEEAIRSLDTPHLIIRTNWMFGARGRSFMLTAMRLARENEAPRIVDDQVGTPTWSRMVAEVTAQIAARVGRAGAQAGTGSPPLRETYHITASGSTTWARFAQATLDEYAALAVANLSSGNWRALPPLKAARVTPIRTEEFPTPTRRPAFSVLDGEKLARDFGLRIPDWRVGLKMAMADWCRSNLSGWT